MRTATRAAAALTAATMVLCAVAMQAQNVHYGESFELNSTLVPNESHEYYAGSYIDLKSGFHSAPNRGNHTFLEPYPYYNAPSTYGIDEFFPADHDDIGRLGFYPMDFQVNENGAATISIPLEFPEGINGMTPHLSLEYNSQAGNGILGLGWSIGGMSKITRVPYTYEYNDNCHSVQFSIEDQLSLDGVILKKGTINGTTCYYPEIYDYSVVYPITGGFKVLKKDGTIYTYTAKYYLQQSITEPIEWHLSKMEDASGNYIEYFYNNDRSDGSFYPDKIRYTGRTGLSPVYEIRFSYDSNNRPDCPKKWFSQPSASSGNPGFSRITKELSSIECLYNNSWSIKYRLSYNTLDRNIRVLEYVEKSIHDYSGEGKDYNRIIPLKFEWVKTSHNLQYEEAGNAKYLSIVYNANQEWYQQTAFAARFEQDNLQGNQKYEHDIVHLMRKETGPKFYHLNVFRSNNGIGENGQLYYYNLYDCSSINNNHFNDGRQINAFMPADTDGDGLDEIVCVYSYTNTLNVSLLKPDNNNIIQETVVVPSLPSSNFDMSSFQIGDFNGDGLSDLLCVFGNSLYVRISTVNGAFSQPASKEMCINDEKRVIVADFNGDQKDQILVLFKEGNNREAELFQVTEQNNTYSIPAARAVPDEIAEKYYLNSCNRLCCGDFNGDGKKDILLMCSGGWRFYFSQGNGLFAPVQLMTDNLIVTDDFAITSDTSSEAFAMISDFDHDGCDDVSITLQQDFSRPSRIPFLDYEYRGAFRRDFLVRPTHQGVNVERIRNLRTWMENGITQEEDRCIDSVILQQELFTTKNVFLPVLGNHKGVSPNEILFCRADNAYGNGDLYAFLHNTGNFYPDSLARAVGKIVTSLGATTEITYKPVSYQYYPETASKIPARALTEVLPFYGFMNIVEKVRKEVEDDGSGTQEGKKYRLTRYYYTRPQIHTRGRGFLGFECVWSKTQGQVPAQDMVTVKEYVLNQIHHVLIPQLLTLRPPGSTNNYYQQTVYTYTFFDHDDFASSLGPIPNGVFTPYLSATTTTRNDGSPLIFEKTSTTKDGYGNVTLFERRYRDNTTTIYPYYEKTETHYENSVTQNRWFLGVPDEETVTQDLVNDNSDRVVHHTTYNNDMTHGRHLSKVTEPNTGKQLTETYRYDSFGNLTSVTKDIGDGYPRKDTCVYSADGRFVTSQTNAKGHTTSYYYQDATGLLDSVTDPNGLTTKYYYDYLCNLVKTELPSGILEERVMKWVGYPSQNTYHPDTPDFGAPVYFVWSKQSGERSRCTFYDQHQRILREVDSTMDGKKVYVDYHYHDVIGLVDSVSAPYYKEEHESPLFSVYQYDYFDRNILLTRSNGAYMSHSYNGTSETVRGFDGQRRTLTYNPAGLVAKVSDYGNSNSSPVEIDYIRYGDGKVKTSMVGNDNSTTITYSYDVNRNSDAISDPSLGLLSYDYNAFGELIFSATPRDTVNYTYDVLGRMVTRNGLEGYSNWQYDVSFKGTLSATYYNPVSGPTVSEYYTYDRQGRLIQQGQQEGNGDEWTFAYGYDALGRRNAITYPSGMMFKWHYDGNGFMDRVTDAASNTVVWNSTASDRWGNITEFTEGDISVEYEYHPVSGLLTAIDARKNGQALLGQAFLWTGTGNLMSRVDMTLNLVESFTYDRFNRLTTASPTPLSLPLTNSSDGVQYDAKGNITQKDGVGDYGYQGGNPYAVTSLDPESSAVSHLADQTVTYTAFDKIDTISQDGKTLTLCYGIDRQRLKQAFTNGTTTRTKRYFTPLYETVTENGATKKLHYLTSSTGLFAIFVIQNGGGSMYYTLKDHQGSLTATVHGNTVERLSYDPWGRRRNTTNFGYDNVSHTFDRGYTLHEHYDEFDLINMNGRLYDPILGRMLSPDIVVQDEQNPQAYNRYGYCFNNPLRFTDPSGYVVEDDWYVDKNGRIVWDDKVTSVANTPEGGTYIGPDNKDILRYYGLRENYDNIIKTRWGFSLNGVMMEYDHNGNLFPNQRPWLIPTIMNNRIEGRLTTEVNVEYNTDEALGTNKQERIFKGITFNFVLSQSAQSFNYLGYASVLYDGKLKESRLEHETDAFFEIEGKQFTKTQIFISSDNLKTKKSFMGAQIRAGAINGNLVFGPRPIKMIWDLAPFIPSTPQNHYTFKYYFLYEK